MPTLRPWLNAAALVAALTVPIASAAAEPTGGWIERTTIARLIVHDWQGAALVFFATPQGASARCIGTKGDEAGKILDDFAVIPAGLPLFKELYATALAASMSGMTVGGFVWGCDPQFNRPQLLRIDLLPNAGARYP